MAEPKVFYPDKMDGKKIESITASEVMNAGIDSGMKKIMSDWGFTKAGSLSFYETTGYPLVRVNADGFHAYDSSSDEVIEVDSGGLKAYGTSGNIFSFYDVKGGTKYGDMGYSTAQGGLIISTYSGQIVLAPKSNLYVVTDTGNVTMTIKNAFGVDCDTGNVAINTDHGDMTLTCPGGDFSVEDQSGIKTAVVSTSKGYKALYCIESPNIWFMDFCYGKKVFSKWYKPWIRNWVIKPDPLFLEVTEGEPVVIPTGMKNTVQMWRKRKGLSGVRFEDKTKEDFDKNNEFWDTPRKLKYIDKVKK